jgi:hypothetical protein
MERNHFEDVGLDGRIIIKRIFKKRDEDAWTEFLWLRIEGRRRAIVIAVTILRVKYTRENFLNEKFLAFHEGFCYMGLVI